MPLSDVALVHASTPTPISPWTTPPYILNPASYHLPYLSFIVEYDDDSNEDLEIELEEYPLDFDMKLDLNLDLDPESDSDLVLPYSSLFFS